MQPRRFPAPAVSEAYARVRDALGDDATSVSARASYDAAATAGPGRGDPGAEQRELAPPFVNAMAGSGRSGPLDSFEREATAAASATADASPEAPAAEPWPPALGAAGGAGAIAEIASQLAEMRELIERLSRERIDARVDRGTAALQAARSRLIDQGVGSSVLVQVLDEVADSMVPDATRHMVLQALERRLAARLPAVAAVDLGRSPLAVFVAGPGGAGKTTVAVRLGVELANERGARVTLASVDVSRAGAPQRLTAFGAATGLPVRLCYSPGELKALLTDGAADVVIVDTPGNDGARRDRMMELSVFTRVVRERITLLTLPATTKGDDIERTTSAMAEAGVDGLVLTRCDETRTFGALLSAACESGIGIAYSTHGEGISEPLRRGDNHALALAIVGGRWPLPSDLKSALSMASRS